MSSREVGLLVYSRGFAISRDEYIVRELAFSDWMGHLTCCSNTRYPLD